MKIDIYFNHVRIWKNAYGLKIYPVNVNKPEIYLRVLKCRGAKITLVMGSAKNAGEKVYYFPLFLSNYALPYLHTPQRKTRQVLYWLH